MVVNKYSNNNMNEQRAKAIAKNLGISTKQSIEMCAFLRGKELQQAKKLLEGMLDMKVALPMRRYNQEGAGHKKGKVGPGKYPINTASAFHDLLENVEVNAQNKGLDTNQLKIVHLCAHWGSKQQRYGRSKRGVMKRTHVEVIVEEFQKVEKKLQKKPAAKPVKAKKEEAKATAKKEEAKVVEKKPTIKKAEPAKTEKKAEVKKASKPDTDSSKPAEKKPAKKEDTKKEN